MQEKDMVSDVLASVKASLENYARVIGECANPQLRSTLQQIRNQDEQFQYQLAQLAMQKNYYKPAPAASDHEVQQIRSEFAQPTTIF